MDQPTTQHTRILLWASIPVPAKIRPSDRLFLWRPTEPTTCITTDKPASLPANQSAN
ncbi:MAG: hypothetical protein IJS19_07425 [Muribaculaceae bacterium]|nr:hypothetical protein [Muribaculaceae bacterium]